LLANCWPIAEELQPDESQICVDKQYKRKKCSILISLSDQQQLTPQLTKTTTCINNVTHDDHHGMTDAHHHSQHTSTPHHSREPLAKNTPAV
jgi:hypothetical protein